MKGILKRYLKIILIIIMAFIMLTFSNFISKGEEYSEIIDYRKEEFDNIVDYNKGLVLYGEGEEDHKWQIIRSNNIDTSQMYNNVLCPFTGTPSDAKLEVLYPKIGYYIDENGNRINDVYCKVIYSNFKLFNVEENKRNNDL